MNDRQTWAQGYDAGSRAGALAVLDAAALSATTRLECPEETSEARAASEARIALVRAAIRMLGSRAGEAAPHDVSAARAALELIAGEETTT